jgi:hypothetical protein
LAAAPLTAGQIEAVKGKSYRLTKQHGPWMIMVASFRDVDDRDRKTQGMTAQEAADELVYELRRKGIPAYTFSQSAQKGEIKTVDRTGREDLRVYAAQREMICVLAGNYASEEDSIGERTLKQIKKFTPDFMKDEKNGGIYRPMPNGKGPLGGAFLTINPLIDPSEIARKKPDFDLLKLNHGIENALVENPGRYTVQVATFTGRSVTPIANSSFANREDEFDRRLESSFDAATGLFRANLNDAGEDAAQLARELRHLKTPNVPNGMEAWVYHDRFESIVTVGSFDNPNDPRIAEIIKNFGAKTVRDPTSGQEVVVAEVLMPTQARRRNSAAHMWVFDPQPRLIEVPRLKDKKAKK